jgi:hypothetical protein
MRLLKRSLTRSLVRPLTRSSMRSHKLPVTRSQRKVALFQR